MTVQHAPDVDVVRALDMEDDVRVATEWPGAQSRQVQFMAVARRAAPGMTADVRVGGLQRIDETEGRIARALIEVVRDDVLDILVCQRARDHTLGLHAFARRLAALRTRSRNSSK